MSKYSFRIRFFLPPGIRIGLSGNRHHFDVPSLDAPLDLRPYDTERPIAESHHLVLEGAEYESKDEAAGIGHQAYDALLWCGLKGGYGVDLGEEPVSGGLTDVAKEMIRDETGVRVLDDIHGLQVYECYDPTRFGRVTAEPTVTKGPDKFRADFIEFLDTGIDLDPSVSLALELANLAYFEESNRAQFLTRMLGVEAVLPDDIPVSDEAQELVDEFIDALQQADLDDDERKSLEGSAGFLKSKSISRTGQQIARQHLGDNKYADAEADDFFKTAYTARSTLVHNGELSEDGPSVGGLNNAMRNFVRDLLEAMVADRHPELTR